MGVVRGDNQTHITAAGSRDRSEPFDACQKERDEDDVEPLTREHQRPERRPLLPRFDGGGETEVTGDHRLLASPRRRPREARVKPAGDDHKQEQSNEKRHEQSPPGVGSLILCVHGALKAATRTMTQNIAMPPMA
jgi:hypothetical protein